MTTDFKEMVAARAARGRRLCLGLDPDLKRIPPGVSVVDFCQRVVEATSDKVATYKPNSAFFEDRGPEGLEEYATVVGAIRAIDPSIPVIGDWKRGDIGNTNAGYIRAAFERYQLDALTVHPYLGKESLQGFLDCEGKGIIVLCRTSNPGAGEFQDLEVNLSDDPILGQTRAPLYQAVARNVAQRWNTNGNCGLVVGATFPEELAAVRRIAPDIFLLIPGVGTQGGDLEASVRHAHNPAVGADFMINVSSAILYAYAKGPFQMDPAQFDQAAAAAAGHFDQQIREAVAKVA